MFAFVATSFPCLYIDALNNPHSFKIRSAAFIAQSKLFRKIYDTAGPCIELEYAYRIKRHLEVWGNFDFFWQDGKSIGLCNPTQIKIPNFSFGIKSPYQFKECHELYLGIGPSFAGVLITNKTCCCCEKVSKPAFGFVVKSGYYYDFCKRFFLDIFADYLYQPVHFQRKTEVGGLRIGAGLGIKF